MKIAITGAAGFLGWHLRCALRARNTDVVVCVDARLMADGPALDEALTGVDAVIHLAGINRDDDVVLRDGNAELALSLTSSLDRVDARPRVVYSNSIQAGNGSAYGDGKQAAAEHLAKWAARVGACVVDVRLPNIFGEHGRPHYNSVVATFCYELANGGDPTIIEDRTIPLLHAQDAVDVLVEATDRGESGVLTPAGQELAVSDLLATLREFRRSYATGQIPDITHPTELALFNTYRSYSFPNAFPMHPTLHEDPRGSFFECTRAAGSPSQVSCSTTVPGVTRGDHFHRRKVERFQVLRGTAVIELRRVFDSEILTFPVSGQLPAFVDMPTMWSHSITNTGSDELVTLFWAADLFDPDAPDTYADPVRVDLIRSNSGGPS